jgi:hypothetical protein
MGNSRLFALSQIRRSSGTWKGNPFGSAARTACAALVPRARRGRVAWLDLVSRETLPGGVTRVGELQFSQ